MKKNYQSSAGITIIELLLIVAIIAIMAAAGIPIASGALATNRTIETNTILTTFLRTARINSFYGLASCDWGVASYNQTITLFCGSQYSSRNQGLDQTWSIPSSATLSEQEVIFQQNTALTNQPTVFLLSDSQGSSQIQINEIGSINLD